MKLNSHEIGLLINAGTYERCYLFPGYDGYEVFFMAGDEEGGCRQDHLTTNAGTVKTYSSVDRALVAIRALGWQMSVIIETPTGGIKGEVSAV